VGVAYAQVVITEVNSTASAYASYIEVMNTGSESVDVSEYTITYGNDGSDKLIDEPLTADGYAGGCVLSPGEYFLILRSDGAFRSEYPTVVLNDGPDDADNASIEWMGHGYLYLNGGADYVMLHDQSGGVVDRFGSATVSWEDNHAFERVHYPNTGTDLGAHWRDMGSGVTGSPGRPNDSSLPVQLGRFSAGIRNGGVLLQWHTESEENNLGFYVLRSDHPKGNYTCVSLLIAGAGTSQSRHCYRFLDDRVDAGDRFWYVLEQIDLNGACRRYGPLEVTFPGVQESSPDRTELTGNVPNPFNPSTRIDARVGGPDGRAIRLVIYNIRGQRIRTLDETRLSPGRHQWFWNGCDDRGRPCTAGVYLCRLESGAQVSTLRLTKLP
jgi:hypothetical protein